MRVRVGVQKEPCMFHVVHKEDTKQRTNLEVEVDEAPADIYVHVYSLPIVYTCYIRLNFLIRRERERERE